MHSSGDGITTYAKFVVFAPLVMAACAVALMYIPVHGIFGVVVLGYLVKCWWIVGLLSLFAIFLALKDGGKARVYGFVGIVESLAIGLIHLQWFG